MSKVLTGMEAALNPFAVSLIALFAVLSATPAWATRHYVNVEDNLFVPDVITIEAGDEVRWVFIGPSDHSVITAAGQIEDFDSGVQSPGVFYSWTFPTVGVVNIYDSLNGSDLGGGAVSGMSMTVNIDPKPLSLATPTPGVTDEPNSFAVDGATPGSTVHYFRSQDLAGARAVDGCPGLFLDLGSPVVMGSHTADSNEQSGLWRTPPASQTGESWRFQAVDMDTCRTSNVVDYTW